MFKDFDILVNVYDQFKLGVCIDGKDRFDELVRKFVEDFYFERGQQIENTVRDLSLDYQLFSKGVFGLMGHG